MEKGAGAAAEAPKRHFLKHLRPGQRSILKIDSERYDPGNGDLANRCPQSWDSGKGFKQCLTYAYTVEVRRVR